MLDDFFTMRTINTNGKIVIWLRDVETVDSTVVNVDVMVPDRTPGTYIHTSVSFGQTTVKIMRRIRRRLMRTPIYIPSLFALQRENCARLTVTVRYVFWFSLVDIRVP